MPRVRHAVFFPSPLSLRLDRSSQWGADRLTALVDKQAAAGHITTNRVEAHVDVDNVAEQRALEATGLQREGITAWRNGATATYHDGILYAVLRDDPRHPS